MKHGDLVMSCHQNVLASARQFAIRYPGVNYSDAVSAGTEALVEASSRFQPMNRDCGAAGLWQFARTRVVGSMSDMVRRDRATDRSTNRRRLVTLSPRLVRFDEHGDPFVRNALGVLDGRLRAVVLMRYWEDATFGEIGVALGLTEGRVSQLHRDAIRTLRDYLCD
jgi:RNA polymerase sigma factor (sigma-70 family)